MYVTFKIRHVASLSELTKEHTFSPPFPPIHSCLLQFLSPVQALSLCIPKHCPSLLPPHPLLQSPLCRRAEAQGRNLSNDHEQPAGFTFLIQTLRGEKGH